MNRSTDTNTITVIRKKGNDFFHEEIPTEKILPGAEVSEDDARRNLIKMLRQDPSITFVLENKDGEINESGNYRGLSFLISYHDGETATGQLSITLGENVVYYETFDENEHVEDDDDNKDYPVFERMLETITYILYCIDNEDYSFVLPGCDAFSQDNLGKELEDIGDVRAVLEKNNYQVEELFALHVGSGPCLFAYGNDIYMIAQYHFHGYFYLETKRFFPLLSLTDSAGTEEIKELTRDSGVTAIHYKDESWGFRIFIDDTLYEGNFIELLQDNMRKLRDIVDKVDVKLERDTLVFNKSHTIRSLFIYEVLDASIQLNQINM